MNRDMKVIEIKGKSGDRARRWGIWKAVRGSCWIGLALGALVSWAGPRDTGGGSYTSLFKYVGIPHVIFTSPAIRPKNNDYVYYREFSQAFEQGLKILRQKVEEGTIFRDRAGQTVVFAEPELKAMEEAMKRVGFLQKDGVERAKSAEAPGRPLTATNTFDYSFDVVISQTQWEYIRETFVDPVAAEIFQAIACHEVASLIGVERTNYYPVCQHVMPTVLKNKLNTRVLYRPSIQAQQDEKNRLVRQRFVQSFLRFQSWEMKEYSWLLDREKLERNQRWLKAIETGEFELPKDFKMYGRLYMGLELAEEYFDKKEEALIAHPDFYALERVHEVGCPVVDEKWLTTPGCVDQALEAVSYNRLPRWEVAIQKKWGELEDRYQVICRVLQNWGEKKDFFLLPDGDFYKTTLQSLGFPMPRFNPQREITTAFLCLNEDDREQGLYVQVTWTVGSVAEPKAPEDILYEQGEIRRGPMTLQPLIILGEGPLFPDILELLHYDIRI